jgi:hypothetical protein
MFGPVAVETGRHALAMAEIPLYIALDGDR